MLKLMEISKLSQLIEDNTYMIDTLCNLLKVVGSLFFKKFRDESNDIFRKLTLLCNSENITKKEKFTIMDTIDESKKWSKY